MTNDALGSKMKISYGREILSAARMFNGRKGTCKAKKVVYLLLLLSRKSGDCIFASQYYESIKNVATRKVDKTSVCYEWKDGQKVGYRMCGVGLV